MVAKGAFIPYAHSGLSFRQGTHFPLRQRSAKVRHMRAKARHD